MGGLISSPKPPATPEVMPPTPMPDPESPTMRDEVRKSVARRVRMSGRASTLLGQEQTLG